MALFFYSILIQAEQELFFKIFSLNLRIINKIKNHLE